MESFSSDIKENLLLFRNLLTCKPVVYSWTYSFLGELLDTNSEYPVLDKIFDSTGCKSYMTDYARSEKAPLLLSAPLGLMWCAVIQHEESQPSKIHVIGPVFNTEISPAGIKNAIAQYDIPLSWRTGFINLIHDLSVVSSTLFFQYGIMLHYCVTGEKLSRSDIHFQQSRIPAKGSHENAPLKERRRIYLAEQAILQNVKDGNPDYKNVLESASLISNGVQISTDNPINQIKISLTTFISLCCRSAIEGGLSPEIAYSLGDSYIQETMHCGTVSELRILSHTMYEDFIQRVRKCKSNSHLSMQIQSCISYIEMHPDEPLDLKSLAHRVGYAEYYLSRKFKRETGISISSHIRHARIERAKFLLVSTDLSIAEIAEQLQFSSSSHFSDIFRKLTGMLPQVYRKEHLRL